jgi:DNA-binding response OmpR family regulator
MGPGPGAPGPQKRILICDDDPTVRSLVRVSLQDARYTLREAGDGEECLEIVQRERPDLIVLDLSMPRRDGLEVLATVRADAALARTLVLIMTARSTTTDRDAALRLGADAFLPKPFSPAVLARRVQDLLIAA